jgi:hypothetical protein
MAQPTSTFSTSQRAHAGAVVTLVDLDTGRTRVEHCAGFHHTEYVSNWPAKGTRKVARTLGSTKALNDLLDAVEEWEGDWRVRTICTPESILTDLTGRRGVTGYADHPEVNILRRMGRGHLYEHDELVGVRR